MKKTPQTPRSPTIPRRALAAGVGLCLAALLLPGCESDYANAPGAGDGPAAVASSQPATPVPLATARTAPRDGSFSLALPADLLVQPFTSTVMATSADGTYRVFVETRKASLLEALGQLKDELIGLGFEVVEERHFETATLLNLGQGTARNRLERSIWLIQTGPGLTLLCDGLARAYAVPRLGAAHRAVCQTLSPTARSPE